MIFVGLFIKVMGFIICCIYKYIIFLLAFYGFVYHGWVLLLFYYIYVFHLLTRFAVDFCVCCGLTLLLRIACGNYTVCYLWLVILIIWVGFGVGAGFVLGFYVYVHY